MSAKMQVHGQRMQEIGGRGRNHQLAPCCQLVCATPFFFVFNSNNTNDDHIEHEDRCLVIRMPSSYTLSLKGHHLMFGVEYGGAIDSPCRLSGLVGPMVYNYAAITGRIALTTPSRAVSMWSRMWP